jgi:hypothetical protein
MKPEDIKEWLTKQPFQAFHIYLSDGRAFDISHPDQVMVFENKIIIGIGRDKRGIVGGHVEAAIPHITTIQEMNQKAV